MFMSCGSRPLPATIEVQIQQTAFTDVDSKFLHSRRHPASVARSGPDRVRDAFASSRSRREPEPDADHRTGTTDTAAHAAQAAATATAARDHRCRRRPCRPGRRRHRPCRQATLPPGALPPPGAPPPGPPNCSSCSSVSSICLVRVLKRRLRIRSVVAFSFTAVHRGVDPVAVSGQQERRTDDRLLHAGTGGCRSPRRGSRRRLTLDLLAAGLAESSRLELLRVDQFLPLDHDIDDVDPAVVPLVRSGSSFGPRSVPAGWTPHRTPRPR